jgi:diadenosine tetraphosphate (Ap4A) HIT family hydrolase
MELFAQLTSATALLVDLFQPDHFNYAFLQNQDRHVHLHLIPRYNRPQTFRSIVFTDPGYPGHYPVPAPAHILPAPVFHELAEAFRQNHPIS